MILRTFKKLCKHTYVKFFFTYLFLLTALVLGCLFIIKKQLSDRYFELHSTRIMQQLDNITTSLNNDLLYLSQVDTAIAQNSDIIKANYQSKSASSLIIHTELEKYAVTTKLIDSIVYMPQKSNNVIATGYLVEYRDDIFSITERIGSTWEFDPSPCLNKSVGQLYSVPCKGATRLVYFPSQSTGSSHVFFYIIDTTELQNLLNACFSDELQAIAILDSQKQNVTGINYSSLLPYMDSIQAESGRYRLNHSTTLCIDTKIGNGFSVVALLSNDILMEQINEAFAASYVTLFLISILGVIIIHFSMRLTYVPLRKLAHKVVPQPNYSQNFFEQLESAYSEAEMQNQMLSDKLQHYRLSIKKSLLDDIIPHSNTENGTNLPCIDQLFNPNSNKELFIVRMSNPSGDLPYKSIQEYFNMVLPSKESCIILESSKNNGTFLLNYIGIEPNKKDVLLEILYNYHQEQGFLSALSYGSDTPMDIPVLFETTIRASQFWPAEPVAVVQSPSLDSNHLSYPNAELEQLSKSLKSGNFADAYSSIENLFALLDQIVAKENILPNFFIRCVLIDMLTSIINCINDANIRFSSYNDLYFETLYFCRSFPYAEKVAEIRANIISLAKVYEQYVESKLINAQHIARLISENCYNPDFSITILADKFQISTAYMSYLIKKELKTNFSDYLWELRFQRASELLQNSDMTVDEISKTVGYYNTSSFCRKFKQETGLTPSQFRSA